MNSKTQFFVLFSAIMMYVAHRRTLPKSQTANPGQTSLFNNYKNISGMKHDFFKLFCMTFIPAVLVSGPINVFSMKNFNQSAVGRALIVALTIAFYHTTVQPLVNYLPAF